MRKEHLRTFLIIVLVLAMTLTASFAARSQEEVDEDIDKTQQELDEGREKVEQMEQDMAELQEQIDDTQASIDTLNNDIAALQADINETKKELEKKKEEIDKSQVDLNQRLRNMYKNGSIGFIDVILSSQSVTDLITNVEMVARIYQGDKEMVEQLQREYDEVKKIQDALTAQKDELDVKMGELSAMQQQLGQDYAKVEANKEEQEVQNAHLEEELSDLEAESAEIAALIAAQSEEQEYQGSGSGVFCWPVPGNYSVSSGFEYRMCPFHGWELHSGIDIPAGYGTSVVAADDGLVISAGDMGSYGNAVLISHGNGLYTLYGHNSSLNVYAGQTVTQGQTIAFVGSTGSSTGNHCHFEVRLGGSGYGNAVDPNAYL